ncbi:hypothetical protein [uncultured Psychroserpens sp.]|uniref:hypothetical protein n=1 Tax=uncultured Psychroserpens sp. TaxID=255436 RepID=UPI0026196B8B|nr:hypothetical protein [uncultured Psychroserpens sp.]
MKLKILNEQFYKVLLEHKNGFLHPENVHYPNGFPVELHDICVIIYWRYKKLNRAIKKANVTHNELLFLDDNSIISIYGNLILPPTEIERNIAVSQNQLYWFLFHQLYGQDLTVRKSIHDYLYLTCLNPLLIKEHEALAGLIVKYAKKINKKRSGGSKLASLKVINSKTKRPIFPMEDMEHQVIDKTIFPVNIYRGDISKLKPK